MARVPYMEKENVTGEAKALYDTFEQQFKVTQVPNVVKALSNSPTLAARVFPLANYFMNESSISPRRRELAVLILMKRLNCEYGFVRHIDIAQRVGLTKEQIDNVGSYRTSSLFTDEDKLVLRYAEELTQKAQVDDDLYRQVQERLGQKEVIELTAATAFWNMMARNLNTLQVELEPAGR
jgi:alkylhydroperoxidase family enzyme